MATSSQPDLVVSVITEPILHINYIVPYGMLCIGIVCILSLYAHLLLPPPRMFSCIKLCIVQSVPLISINLSIERMNTTVSVFNLNISTSD